MTPVTPPSRFVGLHAHSHFSTSDGLGLPQEHIDFALENGMDALALTEHGNVNSYCHAHQHAKELKKQGRSFRFVPGVEAYYHPDLDEWARTNAAAKEARDEARRQKQHVAKEEDDPGAVAENEDESKDVSKWFDPVKRRHHLVLLPTSRRGLENIFTLVSRSYKEGFYRFPRIDRKMLKQHGEDVIVTSACIGGPLAHDAMYELRDLQGSELNASVLDDPARMDRVLARTMNTYDQLADAVGRDHVFAELQFNSLSQQHVVNRVLLQMHQRHGVQLSAAADSHYCRPELWAEREIYKMLGRLNYDQIDPSILPKDKTQLKCELYPKNAGQMWESYRRYCEGWDFYDDALVKDAIERTWHIAHDMIGDVEPDTSVKLPTSLVRPGTTAFSMLVDMCKEGLVMRGLHVKPAYVARLRHELGIIREIAVKKGTDFSLYFITMKAVIDVADKSQLVGCGRGSAAGSLINYVLGVTSVDPLRYGLIFERFLSPARAEWPDVDCIASSMCVMTPEGSKVISDLHVGDQVIDLDGCTKSVLASQTRLAVEGRDVIYDVFVSFKDGSYGGLRCNHRHRLFTAARECVVASEIRAGHRLAGALAPVVVGVVEVAPNDVVLTDITVEGSKSFRILPYDVIETTDVHRFLIGVNMYDLDIDQAGEIVDGVQQGRCAAGCSVVRI